MPGKLRVTQTKSTISHIGRNRATIKALGLHGIGSTVEVVDNPATRGMVRQVRFLVSVEELSHNAAAQPRPGHGGDEHESERASSVDQRSSAGANAGRSRISGGREQGKK
jgi:large subunit ribosomal protein L30